MVKSRNFEPRKPTVDIGACLLPLLLLWLLPRLPHVGASHLSGTAAVTQAQHITFVMAMEDGMHSRMSAVSLNAQQGGRAGLMYAHF